MADVEWTPEEQAERDRSFMAPGAPGHIVATFMHAIVEGRFDDAEAMLVETGRRRPGDLAEIGTWSFIARGDWGLWTGSELLDADRIEVWVVDTEGATEPLTVPTGQPILGVRFILTFSDHERRWRIERIGR